MARQKSATTGTKPTRKPKEKPKVCETCIFYQKQGGANFQTYFCRRYPKTEIVSPDYWCGEYKDA
ncbi:hypothetical protein CRP403_gp16 [Roseobacter phage CRP-403]|uniref:Uncharacterized protein n=1 Tax=Roseobacter phage CRP-403 TaxID=3072849 RepID=A0AAX3ZYD9_9CAUD|nr:hypothetical protein CRP403_gp16 [Roseobacter phage CRP-403]